MEKLTAPSGNTYTKETITINGKTFKLKRDELDIKLTEVLCKKAKLTQPAI